MLKTSEAEMVALQLVGHGFSPALRVRRSASLPYRPSALSLRCSLHEGGGGESNGACTARVPIFLLFKAKICLFSRVFFNDLFLSRVMDSGEERPESLFMKELNRRGLSPTSLMEEGDGSGSIGSTESKEESRGQSKQRERSVLLNSEGLEGLIPRGRLLLTTCGTFFLGFWPLILITLGLFLALHIYFGPSFVHDANKVPVSPPPFIDTFTLLEDESLSQVTPHKILN